MPDRDVAALYMRWTFTRAIFHRGWWLVTSLYLVVIADLSAFQLVMLGTAQNLTALTFEVPTGVLADTFSRKWSVVIAHFLMGAGMLATGLVTAFPALLLTQMLWGLAWTFSSGSDVAWLSDELDQPQRIAGVLTASAQREQIGAAVGLVAFGGLAWATDLATAMVIAGLAMCLLGFFFAVYFPEHNFTPTREKRWQKSVSIFRNGIELARRDRTILVVFAATILVNGADEAFGRLFPKRLIELGLPEDPDPIVWLGVLGLISLATAALALRIVEARIEGAGVARRAYAGACLLGVVGLIVLALAPNEIVGMAGVVLVAGISLTVTRCVAVIQVNRRATSPVRATLQSFLAQVEYVGEIVFGFMLAVLAQTNGIAVAMLGAGVFVSAAGLLVARSNDDDSTGDGTKRDGSKGDPAGSTEARVSDHGVA